MWKKDCKWEREKCVNIHCDGLWHCSPCKQEWDYCSWERARDVLHLFWQTFWKYDDSLFILHQKKQSDPSCTVGLSVNPTVPSPAFFRMHCDLILHHSSELSVCFDAVAKKLSPRTWCWRLVFRKVGWHHNGGDTNKHMEKERGGNSTPLCPICLPLFNLHGSSLRSTSGVLSTATAIYNSSASLGQKHLTHTNAHIEVCTLRFVCFLQLVLYSMPNSLNWFKAMMQRFNNAKLFFLSFFLSKISKHPQNKIHILKFILRLVFREYLFLLHWQLF